MVHRFAVDKMLGRLATWLRIIGQDATYGAHLSGRTLLRQARTEGRVILTRDRHLSRRHADVPLLLIASDRFREQVQQVLASFAIDPWAHMFTRCARCNLLVTPVAKDDVAGRVPPYVFATQTRFVRCPHCRRVYWPATHAERVRRELEVLTRPTPTDPGAA
ncbi:MAG: Mut7-C RNAse domain-containing protein [Candidatus Binatia bacterium]